MLVPCDKHVKPITYHLHEGKSLIIGSLGRLDWSCIDKHMNEGEEESERRSDKGRDIMITSFFPNKVTMNVVPTIKANEKLMKHRGILYTPPVTKERSEELGDMKHILDFSLLDIDLLPGEGANRFIQEWKNKRKLKNYSTNQGYEGNKKFTRTALLDLCFGHLGW